MVEAKTIWYSRNQNKENHVNQPVTFVKTNIIVAGIMVVPIILENVVSGNASVNIYMVPLLEVWAGTVNQRQDDYVPEEVLYLGTVVAYAPVYLDLVV